MHAFGSLPVRMIGMIAGAVIAGSAGSFANQPPIVSASVDDTVASTNTPVFLNGTAMDDSTQPDDLVFQWTVNSGPGEVRILDPNSSTTIAAFAAAGVYVLELEVSDGALTGKDTVRILLRDQLPFRILAPTDSEQIPIGKAYVIRWQMDPSRPCLIYYSLDGGMNFTLINDRGSVSDSFTWYVDASFRDSARRGIIRVEEYQGPPDSYVQSAFVLVDHSPKVVRFRSGNAGRSIRITRHRDGRIGLNGTIGSDPVHLTLHDVRGRTLLSWKTENRYPALYPHSSGIMVYRSQQEGAEYCGRVLLGRVSR